MHRESRHEQFLRLKANGAAHSGRVRRKKAAEFGRFSSWTTRWQTSRKDFSVNRFRSKFNAFRSRRPLFIVVLDKRHLSGNIGGGNQLRTGGAPGDDKVE